MSTAKQSVRRRNKKYLEEVWTRVAISRRLKNRLAREAQAINRQTPIWDWIFENWAIDIDEEQRTDVSSATVIEEPFKCYSCKFEFRFKNE